MGLVLPTGSGGRHVVRGSGLIDRVVNPCCPSPGGKWRCPWSAGSTGAPSIAFPATGCGDFEAGKFTLDWLFQRSDLRFHRRDELSGTKERDRGVDVGFERSVVDEGGNHSAQRRDGCPGARPGA